MKLWRCAVCGEVVPEQEASGSGYNHKVNGKDGNSDVCGPLLEWEEPNTEEQNEYDQEYEEWFDNLASTCRAMDAPCAGCQQGSICDADDYG